MATRFAGYPTATIYAGKQGRSPKKQLLWGDWVRTEGPPSDGWVAARSRGFSGYMRADDLQEQRLLEVCFVDVGQGDGTLIVTPESKYIVVDAGKDENLYWFLRWRFDLREHPERTIPLEHVVITHSDEDHYEGVRALVESEQFEIGALHHNGLVERTGERLLGSTVAHDGATFQAEVIEDRAQLDRLLTTERIGRKRYPSLMRAALESPRVGDVSMLSSRQGTLEGYGPENALSIEVLAPVPETVDGRPVLRRFAGNDGKTKNGHSIVLQVRYRNVSILLGGDLNVEAQGHLLDHYRDRAVDTFRTDVAKACHHGSSDNDDRFLEALKPLATVVSSGDNEGYAHPRPDLLGALGRFGRGPRPLIFSTELGRSPASESRRPEALAEQMRPRLEQARHIAEAGRSPSEEEPGGAVRRFQKAIATYGMVNLRTDGDKIVMAQRLETGKGWDLHCLRDDGDGLAYLGDDAHYER